MIAVLLGCGLRRAEVAGLTVEDLQQREEHRVIADLVGKGGHVRTVPVPAWVKLAVDNWLTAVGISTGAVFRAINKARRIATSGFSPKVIWGVVKAGPRDVVWIALRRTISAAMPNAGLCRIDYPAATPVGRWTPHGAA